MQPMETAPTDGTEIKVFAKGQWWLVTYEDCQWMREAPEFDDFPDGWRIFNLEGPGHIELHEAEGWRPAYTDDN